MPVTTHAHPVILACSPRGGGNTDAAAAVVEQVLAEHGLSPSLLHLRDFHIRPCVSCGVCSGLAAAERNCSDISSFDPALGCPLSQGDDIARLFSLLMAAGHLFLTAPIFFYHLPASLKAFIDRLQPLYVLRGRALLPEEGPLPSLCSPILVAGRARGKLLFQGSLLTLKYAFGAMGRSLTRPLLLRGLDGPDDFFKSGASRRKVAAYAETIITGEKT